MPIDLDRVAQLLSETAAAEIMPRWKRLRTDEIEEKHHGEIVTAADHACEAALAATLPKLIPRSLMIGEESVSKDPSLLHALESDHPVWVVDPLDGTANFVSGCGHFAVMVCLIQRGETLAAWIVRPETGEITIAERGSGAFTEGPAGREQLAIEPCNGALNTLRGALLTKFLPAHLQADAQASASSFLGTAATLCAGYDYPALASNTFQFLFYYRTLIWDHAPGALIVKEAGAHVARFDGSEYLATTNDSGLLCASNPDIWQAVKDCVLPSMR